MFTVACRPIKSAWHGSNGFGIRQDTEMCRGWSSNHRISYGISTPLDMYQLAGHEKQSCDRALILLCVQISPVPST